MYVEQTHRHTHTHTHTRTREHRRTYTHTRTHARTRARKHIHTHTHTALRNQRGHDSLHRCEPKAAPQTKLWLASRASFIRACKFLPLSSNKYYHSRNIVCFASQKVLAACLVFLHSFLVRSIAILLEIYNETQRLANALHCF